VKDVPPGSWILYNGETFPADCEQKDVHVLACDFMQIADKMGSARAGNMVMLGALLEVTEVLQKANVEAALQRLVKSARWMELDKNAIERGRQLYRESCL
jgi:Pyruvate/2-oxoacid:ferredoxin oxidoreductase gamma subunit